MADGIELSAGSGGAVVATDDITSVHYQIIKMVYGALDSATLAASGAGAVSAGVQRVTLASDDPAVTDLAAIEVLLTTLNGHVDGLETLLGTSNTNTGGLLTDAELRATAVAVDGSGVTQPVSHAALTELAAAINASSQMDVNIAASNATVAVSNGGLTELAAAINASSQVDINLAASNATVTVSGTVDLGATDNAVLDAIAASVSAIDTDATTIIGHLDGVEGILTTIDADTGGILTAVQILDNAISGNEMQVDVLTIAAGDNNIGNVDVVTLPALPAGTNNIGDVDVLTIAAGTNAIGNVGLVGRTTGGMTIFNSIDLDESEEEIKGTAGQIFSITAFNHTAAPLYLRFYNATAANTTVGSTAALAGPFTVPGNADSDGAGFVWNNPIGIAFSTAISTAVTTGIAANDTGPPGANACSVVIGYV